MKKRITAMALAVAMCCTLLVAPASAASDSFGAPFGSPQSGSFPAGSEDGGSWALWNSKFEPALTPQQFVSYLANSFGVSLPSGSSISDAPFLFWNYQVDAYGVGSCSLVWLTWWADILTRRFNDLPTLLGGPAYNSLSDAQKLGLSRFNIAVRDDPVTGYKRLYDYGNGAWIVDSNGLYPFYAPSTSTATNGYQWMRIADVSASLSSGDNTLSMTSRSALSTICDNLSSELGESVRLYTWDDHFQCAYRRNGALILCDNDGNPLMCPLDESEFQGAQGGRGEDSKVVDGDGQELDPVAGNQSQVNYTTYQIVLPNGNTQSIDGCFFDNDGDVYVVQTQQNGLINTGDTIVKSYKTYEYTYNISYTTITYIGSSSEFTPEEFDVYYTLPDGRSSADLTKEDLEQLNLTMDVVPYIRSSDDTRLRSLYHFDGNTEDASYWNYATSFRWTSGASLTYLESNAFNGCLYLDELPHDFTITLPSSLGSGDFTVDFRYYQSATPAATNDSYISIGGQEVLRITGSNFIFNGTNFATPVGSWNHLAFVRKDVTLYFYLNGVRQGSISFSNALSGAVRFNFGGSQQTYKYLDELRVTNFAVWESNFTPATVPYDTNLSLVLPTDTVPVADEYWDVSMSGTNLLSQYNLDWWDSTHINSGSFSSNFGSFDTSLRSSGSNMLGYFPSHLYPYLSYSGYYSVSDYTFAPPFSSFYDSVTYNSYPSQYTTHFPSSCFAFCLGYTHPSLPATNSSLYSSLSHKVLPSRSYTLSLVLSNGSVLEFPFDLTTLSLGSGVLASSSLDGWKVFLFGGQFLWFPNSSSYYYYTPYSGGLHLCISCDNPSVGLVYMSLEEGLDSTVSAELVSGIAGIPADDLNTPTLAVRSDIPITQKQIGGVRPTFAERGYVYAMVESGFITSLQQYTGYAWQAVDGRIWTGSRWIPYSSYNVITLSDMYDIADASGQGGYEYIYSQSGFWAWWQKQWLEFKQWYSSLSFTGVGGDTVVEGDTINNDYDVDIDFGTARSNSVGLLQFIQTVFGDLTSGFANFTSLYTSPDDSLDVLFPTEQTDE